MKKMQNGGSSKSPVNPPRTNPKAKTLPNVTIKATKPSVTGARIEKKITPGGMYKIKNKYNESGKLISTDTSRTMKGVLRGAPRKGKVSNYKSGGSVKK